MRPGKAARHGSIQQRPAASYTTYLIVISAVFHLVGLASAYKSQTEDECSLASVVLCYECNTRDDPNCADPFNLTTMQNNYEPPSVGVSEPLAKELALQQAANLQQGPSGQNCSDRVASNKSTSASTSTIEAATIQPILMSNYQANALQVASRKVPPVAVCRGCCVKITSKLPDGTPYVKRTCTTNLQINYFMVGLVCMKESGDRGKMCFCETDFCNSQPESSRPLTKFALVTFMVSIQVLVLLITESNR